MIVEKGNLVTIAYWTYADGKLVDSSEMNKPIKVVFGFTNISKELEKQIAGKTDGYEFTINQNVNSQPMTLEFTYTTFDENTIELMQKNKEIDMEINGFWYPFKVQKIDEDANLIILQYEDPLRGKKVTHKLKILSVEKVVNDAKKEIPEKN